MHKTHRKSHTFRLIALSLIALGALWCGLWYATAHYTEKTLEAWIKTEAAEGHVITYSDKDISGFPWRVHLFLGHLVWDRLDGMGASTRAITLDAWPWQLGHYDLTLPQGGDIAFRAPFSVNPMVFRCFEEAKGRLVIKTDGTLNRFDVKGTHVVLGTGNKTLFNAGTWASSVRAPDAPPRTNKDTGLILSVHANDVMLGTQVKIPFGTNIQSVNLEMRVIGTPPTLSNTKSVDAWNQNSGVLEIDSASLFWPPLAVTADGTLGLNSQLQPEGAFTATFHDVDKTLNYLKENNWLQAAGYETLKTQIRDLSIKDPTYSRDSGKVKLPLTYQANALSLGAAPLISFAPLLWKR